MAELLGMGITHAPMFQFPDENMADILRRRSLLAFRKIGCHSFRNKIASVAIDVKRNNGIVESTLVVVEVHQSPHKGVGQSRMMVRLIGITNIKVI